MSISNHPMVVLPKLQRLARSYLAVPSWLRQPSAEIGNLSQGVPDTSLNAKDHLRRKRSRNFSTGN